MGIEGEVECRIKDSLLVLLFAASNCDRSTEIYSQELRLTDGKPILSNKTVIPAAEAEKFPTLNELNSLNDEVVNIPDFFTRNNRK